MEVSSISVYCPDTEKGGCGWPQEDCSAAKKAAGSELYDHAKQIYTPERNSLFESVQGGSAGATSLQLSVERAWIESVESPAMLLVLLTAEQENGAL